jgi:hypothetical protein
VSHTTKTFNRGKLRRLCEQGRLELADAYHFDDMHGESRTHQAMPVAIMPPGHWSERKEGVCYLFSSDFKSGSGSAWENVNGTVTLYVHSNSNYTFRILESPKG